MKHIFSKEIFQEYRFRIRECTPNTHTIVPLAKALNRRIFENVQAKFDIPPAPTSTRDGFAFSTKKLASLRLRNMQRVTLQVVGFSRPGEKLNLVNNPASNILPVIYISTGGQLCDQAEVERFCFDSVVEVEKVCDKFSGFRIGETFVVSLDIFPFQSLLNNNIRIKGSDVSKGELLIQGGKKLDAADIALLASNGSRMIKVFKKLKIGILSTGNELVPVEKGQLEPGQIFDINGPMLLALLQKHNTEIEIVDYAIMKDDDLNPSTCNLLSRALDDGVSLLLTTGSLSRGDKDLILPLIKEQEHEIIFSRLPLKPGKPITLTLVKKKLVICALPGNPASTFVGFHLLVESLLQKLFVSSRTLASVKEINFSLGYSLKKVKCKFVHDQQVDPTRTEFIRASIEKYDQNSNAYLCKSTGVQASSRILSIANADILVIVPSRIEYTKLYVPAHETCSGFLIGAQRPRVLSSNVERKEDFPGLKLFCSDACLREIEVELYHARVETSLKVFFDSWKDISRPIKLFIYVKIQEIEKIMQGLSKVEYREVPGLCELLDAEAGKPGVQVFQVEFTSVLLLISASSFNRIKQRLSSLVPVLSNILRENFDESIM
eukprot:snap_masked-scaffold_5-processed-gene-5.27-mRNA-1 protein AED:1.00 eAED:1.00 QI:0/-1/0/0/-1/1/1/0/605